MPGWNLRTTIMTMTMTMTNMILMIQSICDRFVGKFLSFHCRSLRCRYMPPMRTAWSATTAAVGGTATGNATTATTAARVPTVTAMRSITAATVVPAKKTTNCATIAAIALTNAASVTKSAADVIRQAETCATCATSIVRSVWTSFAMTAASAPNVREMSCTALSVCCVSAVRTGSATAVRDARNAPPDANYAMKSARAVQKMRSVSTAQPALTVSAARVTTAPNVCCVNSVQTTYVNAAGDAPNVF